MNAILHPPTTQSVKAACERFDLEHNLAEETLRELFDQFPQNDDLRHVLLKVVALNSLCHTCVHAVEAVARHIHANATEIDTAISAGSPEIVDKIARIKINGKPHNFFSFASKYCSWHNPYQYPSYDSRVDNYLWTLHNQNAFAGFLHPELWNYPRFLHIMGAFRDFHGLDSFSFKELDKFIFLQCEPPTPAIQEDRQPGPGAFDFFPAEELPV